MELYQKDSYKWAPHTSKYAYVDFKESTAPTRWIARRGDIPFLYYEPIYIHQSGIKPTNAKDYFCSDIEDKIYKFTVSNKGEKKLFFVTRHYLFNEESELVCILLRSRYLNNVLGNTFMLLVRDDSWNIKPVQAIVNEFKGYANVDINITNRLRMCSIINELIPVKIPKVTDILEAIMIKLNSWFDLNRREQIKGWLQEIQTEEKGTEQNNSTQEFLETLDSLNVLPADSEADSMTTQR